MANSSAKCGEAMSRIGKRPVALPQGVSVTSGADYFEVKGPKGTLRRAMTSDVQIVTKDGQEIGRASCRERV